MSRSTSVYPSHQKVWDYGKAHIQNIKKSIKDFNWGKTLESLSVDSKVDPLNKTLFQIIFQIKKLNVTMASLHK